MSNKIKEKSLKFYKQWMKQKCHCPALNEHIKITWQGWNHIVGNKGATKRPWPDVYRRLKLLPFAKEIIEKSTTVQNIDNRKGVIFFTLEAMKLVTIKSIKHWRKIRVILVEDKQTKKIFLSVMDKKLEKNKTNNKKSSQKRA